MMSMILSIIFVVILLLAAWGGYKRGLILSIAHLAAIVAALYLACLLSAAFSNEIVTGLQPFAEGYLDHQIDEEVMPELGLSGEQLSVADAVAQHPELVPEFCEATYRAAGIYAGPARQMAQEAQDYAETQFVSINAALVQVFCERIAYVCGTVVAFILILVLLLGIGNIPNLTFRIPDRERLDDIGGAVAGFVGGMAYCVLLCWVLQFLGALIGRNTLADTFLARFFLAIDILTLGVGI